MVERMRRSRVGGGFDFGTGLAQRFFTPIFQNEEGGNMSRHPLCLALTATLLGTVCSLQAHPVIAGTIDLQMVYQPRVVQGASANIYAYVANSAPPGSSDLNYSISYAYPYGTSTLNDQTRVAGAGAGIPYVGQFDSSQTGLGTQTTTVTVSDPDASNSPVSAQVGVTVLTHAVPVFYTAMVGQQAIVAQEPSPDPLAFGATGGGESFAGRSSAVNDPAEPTAMLDLDNIVEIGDAQIRAQFYAPDYSPQTMSEFISSFKNLKEIHEASGQSVITDPLLYEVYGRSFDIFVDTSLPGVFTKTWQFAFSDEDIPGAYEPGTLTRTFSITAVVTPVPVPAAAWLFGSGILALAGVRRRQAAH